MDKDVIPMVHAFIDSRDAAGMETYGKPLTTFDGRNSIADAQEEAGDLLNYLTKLRSEWGAIADLLEQSADAIESMWEFWESAVCPTSEQIAATHVKLRETAARMRQDTARTEPSGAAYRTPAERLAEMSAGGEA